ncbi:polysaccharide biosynthesis protein [Holdemania filiformis]|uniref:Polysaccharide biosynthesis protein n=1 Tax=Holdemania filiformis TaxID=61171 RepID=A0A412FS18_9FIRM|nr:oligosaccharide flippase family protein [Holdemania filiformis]RGR70975.1 polysaccharide biosynthesis protein [Holdemania filiformis]
MKKKLINKLKNMSEGAKSALAYTIATLFSGALSIITAPIFARIMTTSQIGIVNLFNSWYTLISAFATLSLTSGGYVVALNTFSDNRDEYQSSVLSLTSLIALLLAVLYLISPGFWSNLTGLSQPLLILMLFGFLFAPATDFWFARQKFEYKYKKPVAIIMISAIISSIISVIVVLIMNKSSANSVVNGRLYANYLIIFGIAAILWFSTFIKGKVFFNARYWRFSLSLSIPLVGYSIAAQLLSVSDRVMISKMVDDSAVGIYGTLYTISSLSLIVWQAIHASYVPFLFNSIGKKGTKVKKITNSLVVIYAFIALVLTFFAPEIVHILATAEYYEAIYIMPPIAAGIFLTCITNIYSDIPVYFRKTKYVMYPAAIAAVLNIFLNYIFIPVYGYMVAAYTTLFSYIIWAVLQSYWCKKVCEMSDIKSNTLFDNKYLSIISFITIMFCLTGILLYRNTILRYLVIIITSVIGIVFVYKQKGTKKL